MRGDGGGVEGGVHSLLEFLVLSPGQGPAVGNTLPLWSKQKQNKYKPKRKSRGKTIIASRSSLGVP